MKKVIVAAVLVAGAAGIAFASLNSNKKKAGIEKKAEKKEKKDCRRTCPFS